MAEIERLERGLRSVLWALRDYLPDLVLIGGWVPHLHRRYGPFPEWRGELSLTSELDVLVDRLLPRGERPSLPEVLKEARFEQAPGSHVNAVWARSLDTGEMIEFLAPFAGRMRAGEVTIPVPGHPGLTAIPLHYIDFLARYTTALRVPVVGHAAEAVLEVRVPTLGAYAVNKAYTFSRRGNAAKADEASKAAKDLLYLHDLMAAGPAVAEQIERDVAAVAAGPVADTEQVRGAVNHLNLALHGGPLGRHLTHTVSMLLERQGESNPRAAMARLRGHLLDLHEILSSAIDDDADEESAWDAENRADQEGE